MRQAGSLGFPFHVGPQCRFHEREREGRSHRRQDVDRNMRRKARTAEPLLMWHRRRKLVRSRGRPRLKLSPRRRRLPRPDQRGRGRSEPRPNRGPRAAPRARRRTLPPRLRPPLRAMQKSLGKEYRRAPAPWTWTLIRSQILKYDWTRLTGHRCRLPAPLPWQREVAILAPSRDDDDGRQQLHIPRMARSGRAAAKMLCRAKLRCTCHFEYTWLCPDRLP